MKSLLTLLLFYFSIFSYSQSIKSSFKLNDSIYISASISKFKPALHTYDTCESQGNWTGICFIDNQFWFGSDAGTSLPKYQLDSLVIKIHNKSIQLKTSGMYNPSFSGKISARQFKIQKTDFGYKIFAYFSDGAGSYSAHWLLTKNKSFRTVLSNEENMFYWQIEK
jgi:hypothetical protein